VSLRGPEGITVGPASRPPGDRERTVWTVEADAAGPRELEVTYFTSGIEWKPFYRLELNEGRGEVTLEGSLTLRNRTGQGFENPQIRLVVGDLRLVENLADAAWKTLPAYRDQRKEAPPAAGAGLSEQYVYDIGSLPRLTLDDTYTLPFLRRLTVTGARVLYRLHPARHGDDVHRVVLFENTEACGLGAAPLAAAAAHVTRVSAGGPLPQASANVPHTPLGEECEVDLGATRDVMAKRRVIGRQRTNFEFDRFGQVEGFDDRESVEVKVRNHALDAVTLEYTDTVPGVWDVAADVAFVEEDMNEVTFRLELAPQTEQTFSYRLIKRQGTRTRLGPTRPK
jgi:hypothetical protein